jgi:FkbM family methyltransferase
MRVQRFTSSLNFALANGASWKEKLHLGYHAAIKPSLAFRGWAGYSESRIVSFGLKARSGRRLQAYVRDNGVGLVTLAEFFAADSRIMPANLPPFQPQVIYDLGANVGIASLFFSSLYPKATVYGFEPLPENFEICALNYRNLPQPSQAFPWAVGAQSGVAVFDCQNDSRGGRLESSPHDPNLKTTGKLEVQVHSIEELVGKQGLQPPDFLKIDVEGAETDVLAGVGEYHRGLKCVYVETHGDALKRECLCWLEARGFKIWAGADATAIWGCRSPDR